MLAWLDICLCNCIILIYSYLPIKPPGMNQAIGYASQHIWCLSQARKNWEGCTRNGIWRKNGGDVRDGGTNLSGLGGIVGASACVIFILHEKIQKIEKCTFWYQLTRIVPDKVQRAVKWFCATVTYLFHYLPLPKICCFDLRFPIFVYGRFRQVSGKEPWFPVWFWFLRNCRFLD